MFLYNHFRVKGGLPEPRGPHPLPVLSFRRRVPGNGGAGVQRPPRSRARAFLCRAWGCVSPARASRSLQSFPRDTSQRLRSPPQHLSSLTSALGLFRALSLTTPLDPASHLSARCQNSPRLYHGNPSPLSLGAGGGGKGTLEDPNI